MQAAIQKVIDQIDLSRHEARTVMTQIMNGEATPAQIGGFLLAMRMKGERVAEISGFAEAMRQKATAVKTEHDNAIDMVGTGGDGKNTFNISTVAAIVVAGCGVPVAKHGNRSVSSRCGSADVLKELGVDIELTAEEMGKCLDETGIAFLFAPLLHPAMKHAIGPRRELGVRTVFNILGPLTNPAAVKLHLIGVYDKQLARPMAEVLAELGSERALVIHSNDGMDEISIADGTFAVELNAGEIQERMLSPEMFGLQTRRDPLPGGTPSDNAEIAREVLAGKPGVAREVVLANAAAGIWLAGAADRLEQATAIAQESIDSGKALQKLNALKEATHSLKAARA